jgi:cytochrome b subunit of formate dehydrogenase
MNTQLQTKSKPAVSAQTRKNWLIDSGLLLSGVIAALSGIYFLFLPSGGYQGGRNLWYNVQILFSRHTWDDLHTWFGVGMILAALIHLVVHWRWVVSMTRRAVNELLGRGASMNTRGRWNLILNLVVALSFLLTALSGIYFLFFPGGHAITSPQIVFSRTTWDAIHTWAGVILIGAAILHFAIHWRWAVNVTAKILRRNGAQAFIPQPVKS